MSDKLLNQRYTFWRDPVNLVLFGLSSVLLALVVYKGIFIPMSHDESRTVLRFVPQDAISIISYRIHDINNHMLNSLLVKLSTSIFGLHDWSVRLPQMLAFGGFLSFSILILQSLDRWIIIPAFLILTTNHYMLDFFSIGRGYGLCIFFMTGAIYFGIRFIESSCRNDQWLSLILTILAILSSFTSIYIFPALVVIWNVLPLMHKRVSRQTADWRIAPWWKRNTPNVIAFLVLTAMLYAPLTWLIQAGQFSFGGDNSFYQDTMRTLIARAFNYEGAPKELALLLCDVVLFLSLFGVISIIWMMVQHRAEVFRNHRPFVLLALFIVLIPLMATANHALLGTKYGWQRTVLYLLPLFLLYTCFLLNLVMTQMKLKWPIAILSSFLALAMTQHSLSLLTIDRHKDWVYDMHTREIVIKIKNDWISRNQTGEAEIGINWLFEPTVNYYLKAFDLTWIQPVDREGIQGHEDYWVGYGTDIDTLAFSANDIIGYYREKDLYLIRNPNK